MLTFASTLGYRDALDNDTDYVLGDGTLVLEAAESVARTWLDESWCAERFEEAQAEAFPIGELRSAGFGYDELTPAQMDELDYYLAGFADVEPQWQSLVRWRDDEEAIAEGR